LILIVPHACHRASLLLCPVPPAYTLTRPSFDFVSLGISFYRNMGRGHAPPLFPLRTTGARAYSTRALYNAQRYFRQFASLNASAHAIYRHFFQVTTTTTGLPRTKSKHFHYFIGPLLAKISRLIFRVTYSEYSSPRIIETARA